MCSCPLQFWYRTEKKKKSNENITHFYSRLQPFFFSIDWTIESIELSWWTNREEISDWIRHMFRTSITHAQRFSSSDYISWIWIDLANVYRQLTIELHGRRMCRKNEQDRYPWRSDIIDIAIRMTDTIETDLYTHTHTTLSSFISMESFVFFLPFFQHRYLHLSTCSLSFCSTRMFIDLSYNSNALTQQGFQSCQ